MLYCHRLLKIIIYSVIHIQALFNDCTFYRGLDAFYIALGHVNLIRNYYYKLNEETISSDDVGFLL